jgi:diguanylate cyclase (GGDEF)-like protein/PAS domain S-box-containing protein
VVATGIAIKSDEWEDTMNWIWEPLIGNLAVSALTISIWVHLRRHLAERSEALRTAAFGLALGLGAVVTMILSIEVYPGVFFDLRSALVGVAALFGGPLAAFFSLAPALLYRVYMGGEGVLAGMTLLVATSLMGLAGRLWLQDRSITLVAVTILAAGIAGFTLLTLQLIPGMASSGAWLTVAVPVAALSFIASLLAGYFMVVATKETGELELMTAAFVQTPDFVFVKNRKGQYVAVNMATAKFHGFESPAEMVGLTDFDLLDRERATAASAAEVAAMNSRQATSNVEELVRDADGEDRWHAASKVPLIGRNGAVIGIAGVTRDITREKQIAADLQESRNRLSYVLTEMVDGIAMFHREGTLLFSNDRYRDLFPLTKAVRRPGMDLRDILTAVQETGEQLDLPDDRQGWIDGAMHALKHGGDEQIHMYDGRWLHLRTRPTQEDSSIIIVSDISEAKGLELKLRSRTEELRHLAEVDGLTELPNRRTFDDVLGREVARTERSGAPLSLLMLDVDKFKAYNDAYGHQAGDQCLKAIGRLLRHCIKRPMDLAARYGGEEFAVVLPETDEDGAYSVALAIAKGLRESNLPHKASEKGRVTISIGVATYHQDAHPRSTHDLIAMADEALYGAKAAGRDRINGRASRNVVPMVR